jgi:hypothetical protein
MFKDNILNICCKNCSCLSKLDPLTAPDHQEKAPKKHKTTVTAPLPGSTEGFSAVLPPTVTQTQCESPERRQLQTHPSIASFLHYITSQSITVVDRLSGIGLLNSDYPKRN